VILAKALFKFEGTQSDDLSFEEDDVITVLEKVSRPRARALAQRTLAS